MRAATLAVTALLALARPTTGQEAHRHDPAERALGSVTFANSGAPAAQAPFLRGMALLHSFEYEDAAESFRAAQHADPAFALAYWGEALTYSKLLWGLDDVPADAGFDGHAFTAAPIDALPPARFQFLPD